MYMHICVGPLSDIERWIDLWEPLCFVTFDTTIFYLIGMLLSGGKPKFAHFFSFFLSLLWCIVNILYSRFFHVYFNYNTISEIRNLGDSFVWDSIIAGFRIIDLALLVSISLFLLLIKNVQFDRGSFYQRLTLISKAAFLPIIVIMIYGGGKSLLSAASELRHITNRVRGRTLFPEYREKDILDNGIFCAQLFDDAICSSGDKELDENQIQEIKNYISFNHPKIKCEENKGKNLIFIIIESYLSISSDLCFDGKEVTPTLNKLKHDSSVYYNGKVMSNIKLGESGDGQFIYMTGLLPLKNKITTSTFSNHKISALPALFNRNNSINNVHSQTIMTIPTSKTMWKQEEMCQTYGIDILYSTEDLRHKYINDSTLFNYGIQQLKKNDLQTPFFYTLLTLSMHGPYTNNSQDYNFNFPENYSKEFCNYLESCHFMDKQLGVFLQELKMNGLFDNSVIAIVADHEAHAENLKMNEEEIKGKELPLYIINSDIDTDKWWHGRINQIDLFPTIIDIMGFDTDWRGLGCSILDSASYHNRINDKTQIISESIIESDFFRKY